LHLHKEAILEDIEAKICQLLEQALKNIPLRFSLCMFIGHLYKINNQFIIDTELTPSLFLMLHDAKLLNIILGRLLTSTDPRVSIKPQIIMIELTFRTLKSKNLI
jgi:hypothetical protein